MPKRALFDDKCDYYIGMNNSVPNNNWKKFKHGMTVAAVAIERSQWEKLLTDGLEDKDLRQLCSDITKQTTSLMLQMENEYINDKPKTSCRGGSSVNALGERWKAVCRKVELQPRKKSELEMQNWLKEKLGEEVRSTQTTLSSFVTKQKN